MKMAEAAVDSSTSSKFFCHRCNDEIANVLPGFKCPNCNSGFIEVLESSSETPNSVDSSDDDEETHVRVNLGDITSFLRELRSASGSAESASSNEGEASGLSGGMRRRRPAGDARRSTRRRTNSDHPMDNLISDFIMNFTSNLDFDSITLQGHGSPIVLFGNPGDYAFGRAGLDAIVTQLLNQMDGTGPPPLAKEKIAQIPMVNIEQEHIDKSLQCSVCWEDFTLGESVRKLVCEHLFHGDCITPWLQLHGTCPVCRKSLNEGSADGTEALSGSSENPQAGTSSSSDQNRPRSGSQSGMGLFSSILGSFTNAFGGGSSSSTLQPEAGQRSEAPRHSYNLRRRERSEGDTHDSAESDRSGRRRFPNFDDLEQD